MRMVPPAVGFDASSNSAAHSRLGWPNALVVTK
jgi:hypothetical protein